MPDKKHEFTLDELIGHAPLKPQMFIVGEWMYIRKADGSGYNQYPYEAEDDSEAES